MFLAIILVFMNGHFQDSQVVGATSTRAACEKGIAAIVTVNGAAQTKQYQDAGFVVETECVDLSAATVIPPITAAQLQAGEPKTGT